MRSNVVCPGFVRTPLVERQIPEQAQPASGTSHKGYVITNVMLKETVDGEWTTTVDVDDGDPYRSLPQQAH